MAQFTFFGGGSYSLGGSADNSGAQYLARLLARKPAEDDTAEAHARWGKPSDFRTALSGNRYLPTTNVVNWPNFPDGEDGEDEQPVIEWTELARTTSDVRVENPDDSEQYVIVQRVETIVFQTAEGERVRLNFANTDSN